MTADSVPTTVSVIVGAVLTDSNEWDPRESCEFSV